VTLDLELLDDHVEGELWLRRVRFTGGDGARVPAVLLQPLEVRTSPTPRPAVIVQHGANTGKDDYYIQGPGRRWAKQGWTILAIDLAEHGERATSHPTDPMVRRRLIGKPAFMAQSLADLKAGVDLLVATPGVDAERIGYAGFSLGGMLGTVFTAGEPRIRAAAIVIAGSFAHLRYWERGATEEDRARRKRAAEATDPAFFAAAIAPRPFLMVNTTEDPVFPREAVETLFAAAREPKELRWHPGTHHQWGAGIYKDVFTFLRQSLSAPQSAESAGSRAHP
jgi:uncharacterized protein